MTTHQQSKRSFLVQIARGFGLVLVLASVLFAALFASLSPMVRESATVQAAVVQAAAMQVNTQRTMEQPDTTSVNETQYICTTDGINVTIVTDTTGFANCENYSNPPSIGLDERGVVFAENSSGTNLIHSVALADINGDGDLDITAGYGWDNLPSVPYTKSDLKGDPIQIHLNLDGQFPLSNTTSVSSSEGYMGADEVAWGDVDNDGDLDLAAAYFEDDALFINNGLDSNGQPSFSKLILIDAIRNGDLDDGQSLQRSTSVAWGDSNGDGRLELAIGNFGRALYSKPHASTTQISGTIRVYFFDQIALTGTVTITNVTVLTPAIPVTNATWVTDLAWNDYDNDRDLDLIVGLIENETNTLSTAHIFQNNFSQNQPAQFSESFRITNTNTSVNTKKTVVALADIEGDDQLDFAITAGRYAFKIVSSRPVSLPVSPPRACNGEPISSPFYGAGTALHSLAWGDVDGDGDPDLAAGFQNAPDKIYLNQKGCINPNPVWESEFDADNTGNGTRSLAWGDMDNDGDLDLVAGGSPVGVIYYNDSLSFERVDFDKSFQTTSQTTDGHHAPLGAVALGDIDNDGDLDVAHAVYSQPVEILLNDNNSFINKDRKVVITNSHSGISYLNLHFGDIDSDGFLDLFVAAHESEQVKVYQNHQGQIFDDTGFGLTHNTYLHGTALADINNDGILEILATNGSALKAHFNTSTFSKTLLTGYATILALHDSDNDGDLDFATIIGNYGLAIYTPDQNSIDNGLSTNPVFSLTGSTSLFHLAWGDMNGDGYPDLAVATDGFDRVYLNQSGTLQTTPAWTSVIHDKTWRLAWGDVDGDGDLDLATGNTTGQATGSRTIYRVYVNKDGVLQRDPAWQSQPVSDSTSIAWGDLDDDGILELVAPGGYYKLNRPGYKDSVSSVDPRIAVAIDRFSDPISETSTITALAIANFHAMPFIRQQATLPITFTLFHPQSQHFSKVNVYYSLNGGGQWFTATNPSGTNQLYDLAAGPFPTRTESNTHRFDWDVLNSGLFGQYEDVVIRVVAELGQQEKQAAGAVLYTNSVPTISTVPYVSSQTYPFRLRGSQVRVVDEAGNGVKDAIVYRIPAGQELGGTPMGQQEIPYRTDAQGYLQGRGTITIGDQLLALAPQPLPTGMAWAKDLTDTIHLYHTNGEVTPIGVDALISNTQSTTVTQLGLQVLQVSAKNPLLLFNLSLSLEWDASTDPNQIYLNQLKSDLFRASEYLYDVTDGQAALGNIVVLQNGEGWASTDIVVQATNRLRPLAVQGGIVLTTTPDEISNGSMISYDMGQVRMGSVWNRFGTPIDYFGSDWALTLAHELSHYLFFQDDSYMGLDENNLLIPVTDCVGSFMGDMYDPSGENTEFVPAEKWIPSCAETLAHKSLARSEWDTIKKFYPMLHASNPTTETAGPVRMPFALTEIDVLEPLTPTNALPDRIIYLDYRNSEVSSTSGRAYLIRDDKYIFELGSPVGGQNRLLLRGGQQGDQGGQGDNLCVIDEERDQYGCEEISLQDERLEMQSIGLTTTIQVRPISATELQIIVTGLQSATGAITATIFPELGEAITPTNPITDVHGSYTWTYSFTYPILGGHIRLWSNGPTDALESIVSFSIGGNPGKGPALQWGHPLQRQRGKGPALQWGHPLGRGRWPALQWGHPGMRGGRVLNRAGNAPVISNDGQMIFFVEDPSQFAEGDLYGVNAVSRFPVTLPTDSKVVGFGYQLIASSNTAQMPNGSISIQYLGTDTLSQGITEQDEGNLHIYFFNENTSPSRIESCKISTYYNLISAESQGAGTYLLLWEPNSSDGSACKKVEQD